MPAAYVLPGIGFSPYILSSENPNNGAGQISRAVLTSRLEVIAPYADSIRTFDCTGDLQPASEIIRALRKTAVIGVWLQDDDPAHQTQIDAANQAGVNALIAQAHAGFVDVAIIGSETQQRGKFAESKLLFYINQVKADFASNHLNIPVTTADTYPALLQHPNVLASVDVVYANFYPFWEQQPVDVAIADLNREYHNLQALVPTKIVSISETGWPSAGSSQGAAVPSPENAASYAVNFVSWARANHVFYSYFEAVDEPFKASQEGNVGPHWGLFDGSLTLKPGMQQIFDGVTVPDNWTDINFASMPDQLTTNVAAFVLSGATAPGNSVAVGGVPIPQAEIDAQGAYAHAIPLTQGTNTLTVTVRDANGNLLSTTTKTVTFDANYSTSGRGLLYVDAVSNALNGTIVIDAAGKQILGIIVGKHVRGVSADGRELYMADRSVYSKRTHQFLRTLPFSQDIPANGFLVSPTGDQLYARNEVVDVATNTLQASLPMDITTGNSFNGAPIPGGPAITPDGSTIFAGDLIKRIDIRTRTLSATGITHRAFLSDLAISPDGQWLVVSSYGGVGEAAIYSAATFQSMGAVGVGDFAGEIRFLSGSRAVVGNAGNPANGGGGVSVIDLPTVRLRQQVPVMLADNLTTNGIGTVVFAASGAGLGVDERVVGAAGTLKQGVTFDLGINRYVQGSGIPANDQIRGLFFSPAPVVRTGIPPSYLPTVASTLTHSAEYYATFVTKVYRDYLGRPASAQEVALWVPVMVGGVSDERVEAAFVGAPEYITNHGGAGAGWIRGTYLDLLHRAASQQEVDSWIGALNGGASPMVVALAIATSAEREALRVIDDYMRFLGRNPSTAEVNLWVGAFVGGRLTNEDVLAGFLASAEYFQSHLGDTSVWFAGAFQELFGPSASLTSAAPSYLAVTAGKLTHSAEYYATVVTAAYQNYLGRQPNSAEVGSWVGALQQGLSDEHLEAGFLGSPEYVADHGGGAAWVRSLYLDLLGRVPSQAEVDVWLAALANGASYTAVAYGFAASAEREGRRVIADYQMLLGRTPSQAEVNAWVQAFVSGAVNNEDVLAGFLGSLEFFQNQNSTPQAWWDRAILSLLGDGGF